MLFGNLAEVVLTRSIPVHGCLDLIWSLKHIVTLSLSELGEYMACPETHPEVQHRIQEGTKE